ncbi:MAG: Holliday junction branch migration protein RuvA [Desulfovibrio sp.]|jgi:Holliday junction DNA helicase RuvA|nr:Holliday junction branch migration protein RuvA [Desulfovibrio sp.]
MIAYIEGRLAEVWENVCLVVTRSGVGYEIALPVHVLSCLPSKGEEVVLYVSLAVREDALELFGFATFEEKRVFETLLTISKVGARTALAILSTFRPDDLRRIVIEEDPTSLTRVSGIGKKNAQHIFLELKYKLRANDVDAAASVFSSNGGLVLRDAVAALVNLGYGEEECAPVIRNILREEPDMDVAGAIRLALKELGKGAGR